MSQNKEYRKKSSNYDKSKQLSIFLKIKLLISGVLGIIGIAFFTIGMLFFVVFMQLINFDDLKLAMGSEESEGVLISVEETNSTENDVTVYEYKYSFTPNHGKTYINKSYKAGRVTFLYKRVPIEYKASNPEISRIKGMDSGQFPVFVIFFILIFPLIGLIFLIISIKKGLKNIEILKYGKIAFGTFERMEPTNESINNQTVYKFYFNFTTEDSNSYTATGKTHKVHKLQDEANEPLVYNPKNPNEAIMLDSLPKTVRKLFQKELYTEKESAGRF